MLPRDVLNRLNHRLTDLRLADALTFLPAKHRHYFFAKRVNRDSRVRRLGRLRPYEDTCPVLEQVARVFNTNFLVV